MHDEAELRERVLRAAANKMPLCIRGGGGKAFYGRHCDGELLDVSGHRGIVSNRGPRQSMNTR